MEHLLYKLGVIIPFIVGVCSIWIFTKVQLPQRYIQYYERIDFFYQIVILVFSSFMLEKLVLSSDSSIISEIILFAFWLILFVACQRIKKRIFVDRK